MTRDEAWQLVCEWIHNPNLRKHLLASEAAMRAYARKFGEDEELWGVIGLLHDLDYERCPSQEAGHPFVGVEELRRRGVPEMWTRAILSHAEYTGVPRQTRLEKALYAVDELVGFITAVAYVRPNRSLAEVDVQAVRKKLKDKAFARGVSREDVLRGAEELGIPLEEHIAFVIEALRAIAPELGL
ncbi:MAG: HDIG domain-containing protein [Armatimonadota bacterium]|nr:HDIG domain-containing protein [Armatimonadota bacterium]MDR7451091.1 HDIG domain-containing protein [Armatimonadota bacterium]MDR7465888.1 HDIG domain-containing protein [Armatimonadota bacterium]MDR7493953.1 HDIG domain-containing protein [Armatimonadota bacterium]MDR7498403.1 HDIG domain-containing protein [Armatimonadota bacterium]